tara:strand:+ start:591 stop:2444 length:1854 start_codon:yes stop_codon:yes gene_type:complete
MNSKGAGVLKLVLALMAGAALGVGAHEITKDDSGTLIPASLEEQADAIINAAHAEYNTLYDSKFKPSGFAGSYLAGFFAQRHHDWTNANDYMQQSLAQDEKNPALIKRAIMLAIGSGEYKEAFTLAHDLSKEEKDEAISALFLAVEAFKKEDYAAAQSILDNMDQGGIADFIRPLLHSWLKAGTGELDTTQLRKNSIHLSHSILIAHYLGHKDQVENLLAESLALGGFTIGELKRAGDIYADIDRHEKALEIYKQVITFNPSDTDTKDKIQKLESGQDIQGFEGIASPQAGIALALYDMAKLFYQENSDDSAHVFAHMSLYLNPENTETHILLAGIAARNERYDEAIAYYDSIKDDSIYNAQAEREIANLLEQSGRTEEAIATLRHLAEANQDMEALIKIGDIYRRNERHEEAILAYNEAEERIGKDNILPNYWHLYYVRGMALEQNGNWDLAEQNLQAALDFKPEQPYVLNYLGYAWADQGKNLDKARKMIEKAAELEPNDGYITDSLGWILYRDGEYKEAVKHLEKAVELLPYDPVINDHLGDAYWKVGRRLEAKFQWERAKNHIEDGNAALLANIDKKLDQGLPETPAIQQARSNMPEDTVKDEAMAPPSISNE